MSRDSLRRAVSLVTEHNRITLLVMVLLTAVVLAGIPMIDTESQAGGDPEDFEDVDRLQKAQYITENYGNASERQSNRSVLPVYVWQESGDVLTKESLLSGLRYQQDIMENESVRTALHEDGIVGLENIVAKQAAGDQNASLDEQIRALDNASAAQVEQLVGQTLENNPRSQRFLPQDHDGGTSSTDRRMVVVLNTTEDIDTRDAAGAALYETANERPETGIFALNNHAWADASDHTFGEIVELVVPVALLLILLVLGFAYRDLVDVVVGMAGVVLSVLWMFGLLGWLGVSAGIVSIVPVVLVTGLSIDFGFHIFNRYREERGADEGIREPMGRGLRLVTTALILVTATAAIGFLANLANPLPLIRNLGVSITLGVVSALVIFVTVVPALKISIDGLLERVGMDRRKQALGHGTYLRPVLERSVTLARRAAPVVLVLAVLVGAVGGLAWFSLGQESFQQSNGEVAEWKQNLPDPVGWEPSDVQQQNAHVNEVYQPADADAAIQSRILVEGDVTSDSTLEDIDEGVSELKDKNVVIDQKGTNPERSPVTEMRRVAAENESFNETFHAADSDGNGIPDQNIEQLYDAFYDADAGAAQGVIERSDGEYRSVLVSVSLSGDYGDRQDVVPKLDDGAATMEGNADRTATPAGSMSVSKAITDQIVGGIVMTMLIALAAIIITLTAVFKYMHGSATLGTVVSGPIVLVVGLVIGGMFLLDIPLTLLTAILMSLVIGLGVDYNIHIGDRFADELRQGATSVEALRAAVTGTGGALLGSTLTSAGAFATIALVPHPQMQSLGNMVVIAMVTSFLVSILVLPSALLLWDRYSASSVTSEDASEDAMPQD